MQDQENALIPVFEDDEASPEGYSALETLLDIPFRNLIIFLAEADLRNLRCLSQTMMRKMDRYLKSKGMICVLLWKLVDDLSQRAHRRSLPKFDADLNNRVSTQERRLDACDLALFKEVFEFYLQSLRYEDFLWHKIFGRFQAWYSKKIVQKSLHLVLNIIRVGQEPRLTFGQASRLGWVLQQTMTPLEQYSRLFSSLDNYKLPARVGRKLEAISKKSAIVFMSGLAVIVPTIVILYLVTQFSPNNEVQKAIDILLPLAMVFVLASTSIVAAPAMAEVSYNVVQKYRFAKSRWSLLTNLNSQFESIKTEVNNQNPIEVIIQLDDVNEEAEPLLELEPY